MTVWVLHIPYVEETEVATFSSLRLARLALDGGPAGHEYF